MSQQNIIASYQKWVLMGVCAASLSTAYADQPNSKSQMSRSSDGMTRSEITPSASPVATDGARFFFSGDFIFWQAGKVFEKQAERIT